VPRFELAERMEVSGRGDREAAGAILTGDVAHIDQSSSRGSYTLLLHDNYHRRGAHAAKVLAVRA
jgi:hypothetical protein